MFVYCVYVLYAGGVFSELAVRNVAHYFSFRSFQVLFAYIKKTSLFS